METLILSCATGGGHHAAAQAMREEMVSRGHRVDVLDPYTLLGKDMDVKVGNCYVKCVQRVPKLFGVIYRIGNLYRRFPGKSPVYRVNKKIADYMQEFCSWGIPEEKVIPIGIPVEQEFRKEMNREKASGLVKSAKRFVFCMNICRNTKMWF